jgi:hypothetical protein
MALSGYAARNRVDAVDRDIEVAIVVVIAERAIPGPGRPQ